MTILILEDETLAGNKVQNLLAEIDAEIKVLDTLKSIEAGKEWLENNEHPELIISDIRLLDGLSFELFEAINYQRPIIFTTAYDQYAIKAFEVNSVDYLLKPIQKEKLEKALAKFKTIKNTDAAPVAYQDIIALINANKQEYKSRFMIRSGQKIVAIPVDKIAYFCSINKLTYIITYDNKKFACDQTLEIIDQQLDPKLFFRANRQFIVKFDAISEIHPYFKGRIKINLQPAAEDDIVISAERTPDFKKWLDQ